VITDRVREAIGDFGGQWIKKVVFADSRKRIGLFRNVVVKPNRQEGARSLGIEADQTSPEHLVRNIAYRTGRPACLTLGPQGVLSFNGELCSHIPGFSAEGPIDIVGAGDSLTAGMVSALATGASFIEAAFVGNLVASITVQQVGVTGTATPDQIRKRFEQYEERFPEVCAAI
jgi:sugar/nucleoside kinase (ribokinase family)